MTVQNGVAPVPNDVMAMAAKNMLSTIHQERARFEVQKIANGASDDDQAQQQPPLTYAQKMKQLVEAEARIREEYGDLLDS